VPDVGETIETANLLLRVDAVDNRRIRKVYISKQTPPEEQDKTSEDEPAVIETATQPKTAT
jgi:Mg2+/Co2+ transporter CorC